MRRQTEYVKGYGYVTVTGDGLTDTIIEGIKTIVGSKTARDSLSEAVKAASKSAGDKLGTKIVEKAFKSKDKPKAKVSLKDIYGDGMFNGRGLKRI